MSKPRVMLHIIMPDQISGPNSAVNRIQQSELSQRYEFSTVTQTFHAGGRVNFSLIRSLRAQIRAEKPDLIHLSGLQASGFHAVVASRLATRVPILITIRGFSGDAVGLSRFKRLIFNAAIEPLTLALSSHFLTVTHSAAERKIVQRFRRKYLGALHNAAPSWPAKDFSAEERRHERKRLGLPDKYLAMVVGRMVTDKGIPTILEVAQQLPEGYSICLLGDGPLLSWIQEEYQHLVASERIVLLGQKSNVQDFLRVSDVFLFATLHENLSNALLEAMSLSLPTIVTNVGGNPEVVVHRETGYLVSPGDAQAMLARLIELKENPHLRQQLGEAGRARIRRKFSQEYIYNQLDSIYAALLPSRSTGKP